MSKSDSLKNGMRSGLDGLLNMSLRNIVNEAMKEYLEKHEK